MGLTIFHNWTDPTLFSTFTYLDVGELRERLVHEVGEDGPEHGLVRDQNYILLSEENSFEHLFLD